MDSADFVHDMVSRASCGDWVVVEEAIDAGLPVSACGAGDVTLLHCAASQGRPDLVARLLARWLPPSIDCRNCQGATPLYNAAQRGTADTVRLLLAAGASVNAAAANGTTPVMALVWHGLGDAAARLALLLEVPCLDLGRSVRGSTAEGLARGVGHGTLAEMCRVEVRWFRSLTACCLRCQHCK